MNTPAQCDAIKPPKRTFTQKHLRLRLPLNWPWQNTFTTALQRIRNLPQLI